MRQILFLTFALVLGLSAVAQTAKRHPRVMEIEKMLQAELQTAVRDLLPGQSFHMKVILDPLHRQTGSSTGRETLPYFEASDEIRDEWDNPEKTEFELLSRVNRISVKVFVPSSLSAEQLAEVKSVIINHIPYVEGRDLIEVEQRNWNLPTDHSNSTEWILGLGLVLLLLLGLVYFGVSSVAISRITKAIRNIKLSGGDSAAAPLAALTPPTPAAAVSENRFPSGQFQINDTIRMTEVILGVIQNFGSSPAFPTLEDMVLLDQYFQSHPHSVGGLLSEFPTPLRHQIFAYSFSTFWLKGLTDPGEIDAIAFELMNKLVRIPREVRSPEWNELLILCWRLQSELPAFLRKIDRSDSFLILQSLPQSIAIQTARELMPGEWASILKHKGPLKTLNPETIDKYKTMAIEFKPLRSASTLEQYRRDMDLLKYLKITDPGFEKEIYGAAPLESALHSLRPPFYPVLEAKVDDLKEFASRITVEDWSLALLNTAKSSRTQIESTFSEKQKFRLSELFRRHDRFPVSAEMIGETREKIGRLYLEFTKSRPSPVEAKTHPLNEEAA